MKKLFTLLTLLVLGVGAYAQYCAPVYTTGPTVGDSIVSFQLATINASFPGNPSGYNDYTGVAQTNLNAGGSYTATMLGNPGFAITAALWIDYNQDTIFDATEKLGEVIIAVGGSGSITFSVPPSAVIDTLRLRMVSAFGTTNLLPCGNFNFGETEDYAVNVLPPPPNDVGVSSIDPFVVGCGLSSAEIISVDVLNYGTNAQTTFPISYSVNGGTAVTETYTGSLAATGGTDTYAFTATADLSAFNTTYSIQIWTGLTGDGDVTNDTLTYTLQTGPGAPYTEDFETFVAGAVGAGFQNGWTFTSTSATAFAGWSAENSGTANSGGTGPVNNNTPGGSVYMFTETSSGAAGDTFNLLSPCIGLGGTTSPRLSFFYHMFGPLMGDLNVVVLNGSSTGSDTTIFTISGQQQTAETDPWLEAIVDLTPWAGGSVELNFQAIHGGIFTSDLSIDDINIYQPAGTDLATIAVNPTGAACYGTTETISVDVRNLGASTLDFSVNPFTVTVDVSVSSTQTFTSATINSGTLGVLDTLTVLVTSAADLSAGGIHVMTASAAMTGDGDATNDTLISGTESLPTFPVPFTEDFETFAAGAPGTLANGWTRTLGANNFQGWTVENDGVQNNTNTGPIDDHTPGGSVYMYQESSQGAVGQAYELFTPCLDLSATTTPQVSFYYHMFGANIGTLNLIVKNGSSTGMDTTVWSLTGQQQASESAPWSEAIVDLTTWAGQKAQLSWEAVRGNGFLGDLAIDDVTVKQPAATDLAIIGISPVGQACLTTASTITVFARNVGANPINFAANPASASVDVSLGLTASFTSATVNTGTLAVLDTIEFEVTTTADLDAVGLYLFEGSVTMTGDGDVTNDSLISGVESLPTFGYPYTEDFETFVAGAPGTYANGWYRTPTGGSNFEGWTVENNGVQNTTNTGPLNNNTVGGSRYMYLESSGGGVGSVYELLSPCIDLSTAVTPQISFWYHMFGSSTGPLSLVVKNGASDGQDTTLWTISGQQQTGQNDPWIQAFGDLTPWSGGKVQIAFVATKLGTLGDLAIDDVEIYQPLNVDLSAIGILPVGPACLSAAEEITVEVRNEGGLPLDFSTNPFSVTVDITGAGTATFTSPVVNTGTLAPLASLSVVVTSAADLSALGIYNFEASHNLTGDQDVSNDTTLGSAESLPILSAPITEDFETFTVGSPGTLANGWTVTGGGNFEGWTVEQDGVTNSGSTGPLDDHTPGGSIYMYTETSSGALGNRYELISPCVDLNGLPSPKLSFWYHMYGAAMGSLEVAIRVGGVDSTIWTISGQQQTGENDPWIRQILDLTPFIGASGQVVFTGVRGTTFTSDLAIDDVEVFNAAPDDVGVTAIEEKDAGCGLSVAELITVQLENLGSNPAGPFPVNYSINGGPTVTETYTGSLTTFGDVDTFTFAATADLSGVNTIYNIAVWTSYSIDTTFTNDTILYALQSAYGVPFEEDFETFQAGASGAGFQNGWSSTTPNTAAGWSAENDGVANSGSTGPINDHTLGGSVYMFTETSSGALGNSYQLFAPCVSLAGVSSPQLSFWYHMYGAAIGSMSVIVVNGSSTGADTTIWTLVGQQQTSEGAPWLNAVVDLTHWAGGPIELMWEGVRGNTFTSDMAIDDVNIFQPYPHDVEGIVMTSPDLGCGLGTAEIICFDYFNVGFDTLTAVTAQFSVNNAPFSTVELIPGSLNPGDTANYCFTATADLSAPGINEIVIVVSQTTPLDSNAFNDTIFASIETKNIITTFPYTQDFEGPNWVQTPATFPIGLPVVTLPDEWENIQGEANLDWAVRTGTSGFNTGPNGDHTTGSGQYLFVDDSSPANYDSVIVLTPCFDVSALNSPKFSFWYHSNNSNTPNDENELHVDLVFNGSIIYDIIPPIAHKDNNWNLTEIDLFQYIGTVSFRFRVDNNNNFGNHDIAIDDINLVDVLPQDAGITSVANPLSGCGLSATDSIVLALANLGTDTIFGGLNVSYTMNGGAVTTVAITDTILPGGLIPVTFPNINFSVPGDYDIVAWTSGLAGDTNFFNDTTSTTVKSVPQISTYPYAQDFESGDGGWAEEVPATGKPLWGFGTPAKLLLQGAASGVNAWATALDSTYISNDNLPARYGDNEDSWVISPCFDFSGLSAPTIEMSVWWDSEFSWDGAVLQSTVDNGTNWVNVGQFGDPDNWYNDNSLNGNPGGQQEGWTGTGANSSGGWIVAKNRMDSLAGEPEVRLRVAFGSDGSGIGDGFAFDDIFIYDIPGDDVGVTAITDPASFGCSDDSAVVAVELVNFGLDTASNIPVVVDVTGAGTITFTGTFPGPLAPGDTANFVMGFLNTNAGGLFNFAGYTVYAGDTLLFNDTTFSSTDVTVRPPAPTAVNDSVILCVADSTMLMVLNDTNFTYFWYDSIGGAPVAVDTNVFQTPFLTADKSYFVNAIPGGASSLVISEMDLGAPDVLEIMNVSPGVINATGWSVATSNSYTNINLANTITQSPGLMGPAQVKHWDDSNGSPQYWGNNLFYNPGAFPGFAGWAMIIDDLGNVVDAIFWGWDAASIQTFNSTIGGFTITAADIPWTGAGINAATAVLTRQGSIDSDDNTDWVSTVPLTAGTQNPGLSSIVAGSGSGGGCASDYTEIKIVVAPDVPVDLGPDGIECSGFVIDAFDPAFASYTWSTGATGSSITADTSGLYYVDVVNNLGCVGSDSIFLTINPSPVVDLGPQDTTVCDMITLDAGNAGATFVWSEPGQFGQTIDVSQSGQYFVTVNSLGCEATDTINVTVNAGPVLDLGSDQTSCIDLTLDAGNPGSTYAWSTGATSQTITITPPATGSDTISVLVTNASLCDAFDEIIISAGTPPVVDLGPDVTNCDSVVLDAGVVGATYTWSGGQTTQTITVTTSGIYSVEVIDGSGCEAADTVDVTVEQKPTADFTFNNPQYGFTYDFTNVSAGGVSYSWNFGDTGTSTDENPTHTYQFPGAYEVTLIVTNACGDDTLKTLVTGVDIDNETFGRMIELYPNPTKGEFFVTADDFTAEELTIKVTDTRGRIVYNEVNENVFGGFRIRVDLGAEAEGVYLVEISDGENTAYKRVIRE